ncbi:hypothetical protein THS27_24910 [Thalassospira sp. MCCC 1A01428]|nr:hypothetical protein THS27_24910 [Thalassospira sp. MCCC 1A01428]
MCPRISGTLIPPDVLQRCQLEPSDSICKISKDPKTKANFDQPGIKQVKSRPSCTFRHKQVSMNKKMARNTKVSGPVGKTAS